MVHVILIQFGQVKPWEDIAPRMLRSQGISCIEICRDTYKDTGSIYWPRTAMLDPYIQKIWWFSWDITLLFRSKIIVSLRHRKYKYMIQRKIILS